MFGQYLLCKIHSLSNFVSALSIMTLFFHFVFKVESIFFFIQPTVECLSVMCIWRPLVLVFGM